MTLFAVAACSTPQQVSSPNPHYKIGAPYQVKGQWYYPKEDPSYEKVGLASWYGSQFQGKPTANGEIFDKARLSAAHKTLPLPSLVEVENLENGKSAVLRVNDRGPFVDDRIIDLSQAAAKALGFENNGLAKVRVRYVGRAALMSEAPKPGQARRQKTQVNKKSRVNKKPLAITKSSPTVSKPPPSDTDVIVDILTMEAVSEEPLQDVSSPPGSSSTFGQVWLEIGGFFELSAIKAAQAELVDLGPSKIETNRDAIGAVHTLVIGPYNDAITAEAWLASVYDAGYARARLKYD